MILNNFLRDYRKKNGFRSQWKLALVSGVPQSKISLIENRLIKPSTREKIILSRALSEEITKIFPKKEEEENGSN